MVRTKLSYHFWLNLTTVGILLLFWILSLFLGESTKEKWIPGLFFFFFLFGNGLLMLPFRQYLVDPTQKCLIVKGYFPKRETVVPLSEFDEVISTTEQPMRGGPIPILLFQKDGEIIYRLTGYMYRNLKEVKANLAGVPVINKERPKFSFRRFIKS